MGRRSLWLRSRRRSRKRGARYGLGAGNLNCSTFDSLHRLIIYFGTHTFGRMQRAYRRSCTALERSMQSLHWRRVMYVLSAEVEAWQQMWKIQSMNRMWTSADVAHVRTSALRYPTPPPCKMLKQHSLDVLWSCVSGPRSSCKLQEHRKMHEDGLRVAFVRLRCMPSAAQSISS